MKSTLAELAESFDGDGFASALICPICGGSSRIAHSAQNINPQREFEFAFRVCRTCKHGWIDPMPTQGLLDYLYGKSSHSVIGVGWTEEVVSELTPPERFVCQHELTASASARTYFELGVGKGVLYKQFLKAGWKCSGVDVGSWGQKFPGVHSNLTVVPQSFAANVMVAIDVLEHVSDPISTLITLRRLAAPDARIYAAMPNRVSFRAKVARQHWRMLRPLGHVNYWSRTSVVEAFSRSGFEVKELQATDLSVHPSIKSIRSICGALVEHLGLGDQWIVKAEAV